MTKIAVFPGTFDPITIGHQNLIQRAAQIFDQVIVAVAENVAKKPLFNLEQRVTLVKNALSKEANVTVQGFNSLLVDFLREHNAKIVVRGMRIAADFEYELQLSSMNKNLDPTIETMFLAPLDKYAYISSSLVKEISRLNGDVSNFVRHEVVLALKSAKWH